MDSRSKFSLRREVQYMYKINEHVVLKNCKSSEPSFSTLLTAQPKDGINCLFIIDFRVGDIARILKMQLKDRMQSE